MATPVPLSTIVDVSISAEAGVQSRNAFAAPLIIDSEYVYGATARVLSVGSLAEMRSAGYYSYHRAYQMARLLFSQPDRPKVVKVGQWNDGTETVATAWAAILAADPEFYLVTVTDRSSADILALAAEVESAEGPYLFVAESGDAAVLANSVGNVAKALKDLSRVRTKLLYNPATVQVSELVFTGTATAGSFVGTCDGDAISVAYGVSHVATLAAIAAAIQALDSVATAVSDGVDTITITSAHALNANVLTITTDLTGATAVWTVTTEAQPPLDSAVVAVLAGNDPGSRTIAGMVIVGVGASSLTTAQRAALLANNVTALVQYGSSIVRTMTGANQGKVAGGSVYVDAQITIDWLTLRVQDEVAALLLTGVPTPYTTLGINRVKGAVAAALAEGVKRGIVAPSGDAADGDLGTVGYSVSVPAIGSISDADKAARILPDVTFQARGAGAIQGVEINGTLTL